MKKFALFFTFFLFFAFLVAEDVKTGEYDFGDITVTLFEEREPEPEPEKEAELVCDKGKDRKIKYEFQRFFYIQPAVGGKFGLAMFRPSFTLDAGFFVKSLENADVYLGLDVDFSIMIMKDAYRYAGGIVELPLQLSAAFDFKLVKPPLKSVTFWFSFGPDFMLSQDAYEDFGPYGPFFEVFIAWGSGTDLVFTNDMIIKFGIDSFNGKWPDATIAVGYRF